MKSILRNSFIFIKKLCIFKIIENCGICTSKDKQKSIKFINKLQSTKLKINFKNKNYNLQKYSTTKNI